MKARGLVGLSMVYCQTGIFCEKLWYKVGSYVIFVGSLLYFIEIDTVDVSHDVIHCKAGIVSLPRVEHDLSSNHEIFVGSYGIKLRTFLYL